MPPKQRFVSGKTKRYDNPVLPPDRKKILRDSDVGSYYAFSEFTRSVEVWETASSLLDYCLDEVETVHAVMEDLLTSVEDTVKDRSLSKSRQKLQHLLEEQGEFIS